MITSYRYNIVRHGANALAKALNAKQTNISIEPCIFTLSKEIYLSELKKGEDEIPIIIDIDFALLKKGEWQPIEAVFQYSSQDLFGDKRYITDPDKAYMSWLDHLKNEHIKTL